MLYLHRDTVFVQRSLEMYRYSWKYLGYHRQWVKGTLKEDPQLVLFNICCRPTTCDLYTNLWTPNDIRIDQWRETYEDYVT